MELAEPRERLAPFALFAGVLGALLASSPVAAQDDGSALSVAWLRTLPSDSMVRGVAARDDGTFGVLLQEGDFNRGTFTLRLHDANGEERWSHVLTAGGCADGRLAAFRLVHTKGVGFTTLGRAVRGMSTSYDEIDDLWLVRVDDSGQRRWQKLIGSPRGDEHASDAMVVGADGRVAVFYAQRTPPGLEDQRPAFVTALTATGDHLWTARLAGFNEWASRLAFGTDERVVYLAAGLARERTRETIVLTALDKAGAVVWQSSARASRWTEIADLMVENGAVRVTAYGDKLEHRGSFQPGVNGAALVETPLPLPKHDAIQVGPATLYLSKVRNGSEPRELLELRGDKIIRHPFALPPEIADAPCPSGKTCHRDIRVHPGAVLTAGTIVLVVEECSSDADREGFGSYRCYDWLMGLRLPQSNP